ncbi:putative F-box protein At4g22170 [Curcuma longa]|uniref:putative F-box protein At4g22170 n=1 Tax=Curcuma longa TaxID=136217 RepID=UPI003D9DFB27
MGDDVRDWSLLPLDLLTKLGENLEFPHQIVFRTVCKSWCSALPCIVSPCPWLLLPSEQINSPCTFLSLPSNNEPCSNFLKYSPVPPLYGMRYAGSNVGWVAIVDLYFNISLLNPLTGAQMINLPSLLPLPGIEPLPNHGGYLFHADYLEIPLHFEFADCRDYYIQKVVFSSNPTPNDYMAMVIYNTYPSAYTKAGMSKWIHLDMICHDIVYHDGLFYIIRYGSEVVTIDLSGDDPVERVFDVGLRIGIDYFGSFLSYVDLCHYQIKYLAFSSTGELFMIMRCNAYVDIPNDTVKKYEAMTFIIFKYNCENSPCWEAVRCLENKSIFIGMNNAYVLSIEDFPKIRANCIYFTDTWEGLLSNARVNKPIPDFGLFDLEEERLERWCSPFPYEETILYSPPIWFLPSS